MGMAASRMVFVALAMLALSCAHASPDRRGGSPVPYHWLAESVDRATLSPVERRGYDIYIRDIAAARASELAVEEGAFANARPIGWIVVPHGRGMLVRYVDAEDRAVVDVSVDPWSALSPLVTPHAPGEPLSRNETAMWHARELVANQFSGGCSDRYNTVVIPETDDPDSPWLVYMLVATLDPNLIMMAGHHRYRVDASGAKILEHFPLSRSCLALPYSPDSPLYFVTHSVTPEPVETHVFLSLLHGISILVGVGEPRSNWRVENGRIERLRD